ncbi:hypothetical protein MBRA1_003327 [Malassezia brasiliensis]|uniref:BTB domain-containing protein n=1 Tax=Malassezia brasiliensis TaxID=1821822 RepID=A0AAF0DVQ7_9BASI|nr:hypothetical protein MBRA1_003327 [Malassezia brasiliensis]
MSAPWAHAIAADAQRAWRTDLRTLEARRTTDPTVYTWALADGTECAHKGILRARLHGALASWLCPRGIRRWWSRSPRGAHAAQIVRDVVHWMYTDEGRTDLAPRLARHLRIGEAAIAACLCPLQDDLRAGQADTLDPDLCAVRCTSAHVGPLSAAAMRCVVAVVHAAHVPDVDCDALLDAADALDMLGVRHGGAWVRAEAWARALAGGAPLGPLADRGACPVPAAVLAAPAHVLQTRAAWPTLPAAVHAAVAQTPASLVVCLVATEDPASDPLAPAFVDAFPAVVHTAEWKTLIASEDLRAARLLEVLCTSLPPHLAALRYEQLVGLVELAEEPPRPTGALLEAIEAQRVRLVRHLQREWVAVRRADGFETLANWSLKELSDALDVEVHALRTRPVVTARAGPANTSVLALTSAGLGDVGAFCMRRR